MSLEMKITYTVIWGGFTLIFIGFGIRELLHKLNLPKVSIINQIWIAYKGTSIVAEDGHTGNKTTLNIKEIFQKYEDKQNEYINNYNDEINKSNKSQGISYLFAAITSIITIISIWII
jgi:hypothetical protein